MGLDAVGRVSTFSAICRFVIGEYFMHYHLHSTSRSSLSNPRGLVNLIVGLNLCCSKKLFVNLLIRYDPS